MTMGNTATIPMASAPSVRQDFSVLRLTRPLIGALLGPIAGLLIWWLPLAVTPTAHLRERQEDLGPLTMFFLKSFSQKLRKEVVGISKEALGLLERYSWPGNVRELEKVVEQAVARCQGSTVTVQDLPQALQEPSRAPGSSGDAFRLPAGGINMSELEKRLIRQVLELTHHNKSQAAKFLGLSRTQLRDRLKHYGLETD